MTAELWLEELDVSGPEDMDEPEFSGLAERHRRELHVHCYRMLGSFEDAEDAVQETFLRAWRWREAFEGRSTFRAGSTGSPPTPASTCSPGAARSPRPEARRCGSSPTPTYLVAVQHLAPRPGPC